MLCLIVSDIHSNLPAFDAVLEDAGSFDEIWCLGDVVGYGPDPNACIDRLREYPHICVAGNHDWGALGKLDIHDFNDNARCACLWTRGELNPAGLQYLDGLAESIVKGHFTIVHGSPRYPIWEYILFPEDADANFSHFDAPFCLVGHTHVPWVFSKTEGSRPCKSQRLATDPIPLEPGAAQMIINPGGVGQPRDHDPRAAFVILDTDSMVLEHRRVPYPVDVTQSKMEEVGLPAPLIQRLSYGL